MTSILPQQESDPRKKEARERYLRRMQARYQYAYEFADTIAVVARLPWREIPRLRYWLIGAINLVGLLPSLPGLALTYLRYLAGRPLQKYRDFVFFPFSPQPNPGLFDNFQKDDVFGLQRVIGVNPVVLRAVSRRQPLPEKMSASALESVFCEQVDGIDCQGAIENKRLYVLDYAQLKVLQDSPGEIDGGRRQHVTTPIVVLFLQADGMLQPIAIQLHQTGDNDTIYSAKDGNLWSAAKTFTQIADGNHHILYTHATRIHYVMEAVIIAARRRLHEHHPLFALLDPHLEFTLNINHQHTFLRNGKGQPGRFGEIFAGDYDATMQCMADAMTSFDFAETAFPRDIADREVDNPDLFYPYRDDGILLWDAIGEFVGSYVDVFYDTDSDVIQDAEINAWAGEIGAADKGRIKGFPHTFTSKEALSATLGQIIFLCTAHHSCIHFNQYSYPGFVPNMPYAAYSPPPSGTGEDMDAGDLFRLQPAFRAAYTQTWTYYLTNFRVNRIGDYNPRRFDPQTREVFTRFRSRLQEIEREIDRRNSNRAVAYERLKPSMIPNSVSV